MSDKLTEIELPTIPFDITKAKKFNDDGGQAKKLKLYTYIVKYFYQTNTNIFLFYDVETDKFIQYRKEDIKSVYFSKMGNETWTWFNQNGNIYKVDTSINTPKVYKKNNQYYVNFSGRMKHTIRQKYNEFSEEVKNKCQLFLSYIREILTTNEEQYNYILKWISVMCKGEKNTSALYLKSIEGTGKSTLFEFIREHLIGRELAIKVCDTKILTGNFNILLLGALFIEFSEFPTLSVNEWNMACSKIKDMVTSNDMVFEAKGKDSFSAKFLASMCFVSNYDCMKESQGRRFYIVDINTHRIGDDKYWTNLRDQCFNDEIGNALFHYFYEIDTSNFDSQHNMPITNSKKDAISKRLNVVEKFLKDEYVLKRKEIKPIKVEDLYNDFLDTSCVKMDKKDFNNKMRELGIEYYKSNSSNKYKISLEQLNEIAEKKHWIHELDEFKDDGDDEDIEDKLVDMFDDTKEENKTLKQQNEELKKQLQQQQEEIEKLKLLLKNVEIQKEELPAEDITIGTRRASDTIKLRKKPLPKKKIIEDSEDESDDDDEVETNKPQKSKLSMEKEIIKHKKGYNKLNGNLDKNQYKDATELFM